MKNNKPKTSCKRGFTLIELLVVVLIIGILAAVVVPQYKKAILKAQVIQVREYITVLYKAAQVYRLAQGEWPSDIRTLDVDLPNVSEFKKTTATSSNHIGAIFNDGTLCVVLNLSVTRVACSIKTSLGFIYLDRTDSHLSCRGYSTDTTALCKSLAVGEGEDRGATNLDYPIE